MNNRLLLVAACSILFLSGCKDEPQPVQDPAKETSPEVVQQDSSVTSSFTTNDGRKEDFGFNTTTSTVDDEGTVVIGEEEVFEENATNITEAPVEDEGATPDDSLSLDGLKLDGDTQAALKERFGMKDSSPSMELPEESQESSSVETKPVIDGTEIKYSEVDVKTASADIQAWVDQKKKLMGVSSKEDKNLSYLLVSAGEKPNSGTTVVIDGVYQTKDRVKIPFTIKEPASEMMTLQVVSYPYKLIVIPKTDLPINFERY